MTATLTLATWLALPTQECCGATNSHCRTPIHEVFVVATGCERCGHSKGCHN